MNSEDVNIVKWADNNLPKGKALDEVISSLKAQEIETPSWGYADSGTRFYVFEQPQAAKTIFQKISDAAQVHKYTGIAPKVALHIPWDKTDNWQRLSDYAREKGIELGAVNPNLFQDDEYKLGSLANPDPEIRNKAVNHIKECIEIMQIIGSKHLSIWLADGTNYPGQDSFTARKYRLEETLTEVYNEMDESMVMLIEYKYFEPSFYHTDIADWGMATHYARKLGEKAKTLVDLGHHPQGANIEHIVAFLIDEDKLGGFHFNNRKYADDDLTSGSINPYELFLIYTELVKGYELKEFTPAYMIDQCHNIKPKIEAMIQSVVRLQELYAKALLVDYQSLEQAQKKGNVVEAEEILQKAYQTDVKPLLKKVRQELECPPDPLNAYMQSDYRKKIENRNK